MFKILISIAVKKPVFWVTLGGKYTHNLFLHIISANYYVLILLKFYYIYVLLGIYKKQVLLSISNLNVGTVGMKNSLLILNKKDYIQQMQIFSCFISELS